MTQESIVRGKLESEIVTAPGVSKTDVPFDTASRAYSGTSFDPEARAYRQQLDYVRHMNNVYADLSSRAKTPEQKEMLKEEFERYRQGYLKHQLEYLYSHSRIVSAFIAGPSNFPVNQMRKRNDATDNKVAEWMNWDERAQRAINKKLNPTMYAISSDRDDAVDLLKEKLRKAEETHKFMLDANKIVRQKTSNDEKVEAIKKLGVSEETAKKVLTSNFMGGAGFETFHLQNSNANIKRMKERIISIEKQKSQTSSEMPFDGGTIRDNVEDNRIQLDFDSKPSPEMIKKLKSRGFHWSPYLKVWQRMRSNDANYAVQDITGVAFKPVKGTPAQTEVDVKEEDITVVPMPEVKQEEPEPQPLQSKTTPVKEEKRWEVKEPWQMTQKEFIERVRDYIRKQKQREGIPYTEGNLLDDQEYPELTHRSEIGFALAEGKPVPAEVLKDYPDLKPIKAETEKSKTAKPPRKAKDTAIPSISELRAVHAQRRPQSIIMDEGQSHKVTIAPSSPRVKSWMRDQGVADVEGIDTPGRIKASTPSYRKAKRPNNSGGRDVYGLPGVVQKGRRRHHKL